MTIGTNQWIISGTECVIDGKRFQPAAKSEPHPAMQFYGVALAYDALQDRKQSDEALNELIKKYSHDAAYQIAEVYAVRGEADRAFEWLERAYNTHDGGLIFFKGDPLLKNLELDPRYKAILKKMRLPT